LVLPQTPTGEIQVLGMDGAKVCHQVCAWSQAFGQVLYEDKLVDDDLRPGPGPGSYDLV